MKEIPQNVSESVRKRNPHLYGFRAVETSAAQPAAIQTLERSKPQRKRRKGRVEVIVTLIACRYHLSDDDAIAISLKPIRDAIANDLGLDDGDARIRFNCAQCRTSGEQGVIVRIENVGGEVGA